MTEPIAGDDCFLEDYRPQNNGGPRHLINVTINETISTKTRIERRDRKGVAMSVGPCGLTVGRLSHSLWVDPSDTPKKPAPMRLAALFENPGRLIRPIPGGNTPERGPVNVESLSLGRWTAISGAAFTTGLGSQTRLGLIPSCTQTYNNLAKRPSDRRHFSCARPSPFLQGPPSDCSSC